MKRTLIIRPGAIGDAIVSLPALEYLRSDYTEVWAPSPNLPLFQFANRARSIASTGIELLGVRSGPPPSELATFDRIISWYGSNRQPFRDALAGLPVQFHPALPTAATFHATDFYCAQVGAPPCAIPKLPISAPKRDFIAIHPFSGSVGKNWPLPNFQQLAASLPLPVEWAATADAQHRFQSLQQVAEWLSSARLYIGNDSGITHLAAAVGTPVIALFRAPQSGIEMQQQLGSNPAVWAPRGPHVTVVDMNTTDPHHLAHLCVRLLNK